MIRGLDVSRISLGCAPLAGLYSAVAPEVAEAALHAALDAGITYFDTAPHYAVGLSETRTGAVLSTVPRDSFRISTKVGRLLEPGRTRHDIFEDAPDLHSSFDFSADGVRRSLEASLARLGLDRVDIVYVHDPDNHMDQALAEAFPVLRQWRDEGVVRAIGAGMNHASPLTRIVREADVDVVLLAGQYTLLDQTGLEELFPACEQHNVRVTAAAVFNSGVLANPSDDATFFYSPAAPEIIERARRMQAVCYRHGATLAAAAMQFPAGHPVVETVLVGMRSPDEIATNVAAFNTPVPSEVWSELKSEGLLPAYVPTP
jgi:D-threo-aldose 1-dehydrogenase